MRCHACDYYIHTCECRAVFYLGRIRNSKKLKKNVDEIQKIKDLELKIVDKKIDEINKNLKKLSSDEFIKDFKKDLKKQLDEFKKSTIESFENELNIKVDTTKNEKN